VRHDRLHDLRPHRRTFSLRRTTLGRGAATRAAQQAQRFDLRVHV